MKKVSIIVPVYNAEKYIGNCIESILAQTYQDIEIILINDGSSDSSDDICSTYVKNHSCIKYVKQENGGVSSARNKGIDMAAGVYIQFVDSDDMLTVNSTECLVRAMERWDTELVICGYYAVTSYRDIVNCRENVKEFNPIMALDKKGFLNSFTYMLLDYENMSLFSPWNKLYKRDIVEDNQIYFPLDMQYGEDMRFNLKYYQYCSGVLVLSDKLYYYLNHNPESLERKFKKDLFNNQKELYEKIKMFLVENKAYLGHNVINLSDYFVCRVMACLHNLTNSAGEILYEERYQIIKQIIDDVEVRRCISYSMITLNEFDRYLVELLMAKDYIKLNEVIRKPSRLISDDLVEDEYIDKDPAFLKANQCLKLYRWMKRTGKSLKKYGVCISFNRIVGKLRRYLWKRR